MVRRVYVEGDEKWIVRRRPDMPDVVEQLLYDESGQVTSYESPSDFYFLRKNFGADNRGSGTC